MVITILIQQLLTTSLPSVIRWSVHISVKLGLGDQHTFSVELSIQRPFLMKFWVVANTQSGHFCVSCAELGLRELALFASVGFLVYI